MTVSSASACSIETPGFRRPSRNQYGSPFVSRVNVAGMNTSAPYQPKRGGMMPTSVRGVPFSTSVLFRIERSPPKRSIHVL